MQIFTVFNAIIHSMQLTKDSQLLVRDLFTFQCKETSVTTKGFQNDAQSKFTDCLTDFENSPDIKFEFHPQSSSSNSVNSSL